MYVCVHGFRAKLSTDTPLYNHTNKIYDDMYNKRISLLTLCDLSKAFDSFSHDILLRKLSLINVDTFWFNDYINDWKQSVRIGSTISSQQNVPYGVPQGSILGPILFNIHVNDMSSLINNCLIVQYADDDESSIAVTYPKYTH